MEEADSNVDGRATRCQRCPADRERRFFVYHRGNASGSIFVTGTVQGDGSAGFTERDSVFVRTDYYADRAPLTTTETRVNGLCRPTVRETAGRLSCGRLRFSFWSCWRCAGAGTAARRGRSAAGGRHRPAGQPGRRVARDGIRRSHGNDQRGSYAGAVVGPLAVAAGSIVAASLIGEQRVPAIAIGIAVPVAQLYASILGEQAAMRRREGERE